MNSIFLTQSISIIFVILYFCGFYIGYFDKLLLIFTFHEYQGILLQNQSVFTKLLTIKLHYNISKLGYRHSHKIGIQ